MTPRRSIAILTLSRGEGDLRASEVIQRALQDGEGNFDIRIVDAFELSRAWFRRIYATRLGRAWQFAREAWRKLSGRASDRQAFIPVPEEMLRRGCREGLRRLRESPPDLVIAAGTGATQLAALAKRDGWIACPILAVQTQLEIEPGAARDEIDVFAVASEDTRANLIAEGISPNRVVLCGYPIDPAFSLPFDVEELMPALGLDARRPVVLVMTGQRGAREVAATLAQLERCQQSLQVLVVAGRDSATKAQTEALRGRIALDFQVFGWTDMVPEMMAAADLLVTKPAALPTAEALTLGLPMVLTPASSPAEAKLAQELEQAGAAECAPDTKQIPQIIERLLGDPDSLSRMGIRARELGRPAAAHAIAQMAAALLDTSSYIDFLAAPPARPGESAYLM